MLGCVMFSLQVHDNHPFHSHFGHLLCMMLCRFLAGDDKEAEQRRSCMFKLIPSVVKGSWVIKQAVGNTPVLLGKKLTTRYYR